MLLTVLFYLLTYLLTVLNSIDRTVVGTGVGEVDVVGQILSPECTLADAWPTSD